MYVPENIKMNSDAQVLTKTARPTQSSPQRHTQSVVGYCSSWMMRQKRNLGIGSPQFKWSLNRTQNWSCCIIFGIDGQLGNMHVSFSMWGCPTQIISPLRPSFCNPSVRWQPRSGVDGSIEERTNRDLDLTTTSQAQLTLPAATCGQLLRCVTVPFLI